MRIISDYIFGRYLAEKAQPFAHFVPANIAPHLSCTSKEEAAELHSLGEYDTAVPQALINEIQEATGKDISHQLVWCYDGNNFGYPYPLTIEAETVLSIYNHIKGE